MDVGRCEKLKYADKKYLSHDSLDNELSWGNYAAISWSLTEYYSESNGER